MTIALGRERATACGAQANSVAEKSCGESRNTLRTIDAVMRVARGLWPVKTATELSIKSGASQRACEYWLARKHDMTADALAALLRSEEGLNFLEAIMGDARPVWWRAFRRRLKRAQLRKQIEELQHELNLEDAAE